MGLLAIRPRIKRIGEQDESSNCDGYGGEPIIGCSEDETQGTDMPAIDSGVVDSGVQERTDSERIADAGETDAGETDAGETDAGDVNDSGTTDGGAIQDATSDAGNLPTGSAGCGATQSPASGVYNIDVNGTTREFHIVLPDEYNANTRHKLIFVWHGIGGTAEAAVELGLFGLLDQNDGSAILLQGRTDSRAR